MSKLGDIRRYVKRVMLDRFDSIQVAHSRQNEIKKFRDPRRVAIFSKVNLTPEQKNQIDTFYLANYGAKIPYTWHRHFTAFTGNFDYKYFPELLYIPEFEHFMNYSREYIEVFTDKNVLPLIAQSVGIKTPRLILSRTCGIFRDSNYHLVSEDDAVNFLIKAGEVFVKPSVGTSSGVGCEVVTVESRSEALAIFERLGSDFTVQERLRCCEDISAIYPGSVNTFRIITYIWHGEIRHTLSLMRIGQGGNYLDNAHAGGMFIAIDDDGTLHDKAFTEFNTQFTEHPDTHMKFSGRKINDFPKALKSAKRMHEAIPQVGIINWDFTVGEDGSPIIMEGNMRYGSIWLAQMSHGRGLFGDDTAEILQWTRKMKSMKLSERIRYIKSR